MHPDNALHTKTLKERIKTKRKSFKPDKSNAVTIGTIAIKLYLSIRPVGLVWLAGYCGKMHSRHLFLTVDLRANDAQIVRSRDAQCNTEESPKTFGLAMFALTS